MKIRHLFEYKIIHPRLDTLKAPKLEIVPPFEKKTNFLVYDPLKLLAFSLFLLLSY